MCKRKWFPALNKCCIQKNLISLSSSELAGGVTSLLTKAASEAHAVLRGASRGDDFIWQHPTLAVSVGPCPFQQLYGLRNFRNGHEIITLNCLQRVVPIYDCLKAHKHILAHFTHFKGYPIHKGVFPFLLRAVKTKPGCFLPNLLKVCTDLFGQMWWKTVSSLLSTGPRTSLHLSSAPASF